MNSVEYNGIELQAVEQHGCKGCFFEKDKQCLEIGIICRELIDCEWVEFIYIKPKDNDTR